MKIDYSYIKLILEKMEENPSSQVLSTDLFCLIHPNTKMDDSASVDKFSWHIKMIADASLIKGNSGTPESWFFTDITGPVRLRHIYFSGTLTGATFLSSLNQPGVIEKMKNIALPIAVECSKTISTSIMTAALLKKIGL